MCIGGGSISNSSQGATVNCLYLGRYTVDYSTNLHLPFPLTYLQTQQNVSHCALETHDLWVGRKVEDRIYKEINSLYSSISFFPLFAFSFHPLAAATSASFYLSCEKEALKLKARFVQILLLLRLAHANASSSLFGILSARRSLYNWNIKPPSAILKVPNWPVWPFVKRRNQCFIVMKTSQLQNIISPKLLLHRLGRRYELIPNQYISRQEGF